MSRKIVLFALFFTFFLFQDSDAKALKQNQKSAKNKHVDIFIFSKKDNKFILEKGLIDSKGLVATKCSFVLKWLKEAENNLIIKTHDGKIFQIGKIRACNIKKDIALFFLEPINPEESILPNEIKIPSENKTQIYESEKPTINIETDNVQDLYEEGLRHQKLKNYNQAIAFYKKALMLKPDFIVAHINLGNVYFIKGVYLEAIETYNNALKLSNDNLSILSKLGTTYLILENYEKAIETYKQIINLKPDSPDAYFSLGLAYLINGDNEEAFNEYIKLQTIDPQLAENLFDILYR